MSENLTPSAAAVRAQAVRLYDLVDEQVIESRDLTMEEMEDVRAFINQFTVNTWVQAETLGSVKEIAKAIHVQRTVVTNWFARRPFNHVPNPVAELGNGPVYVVPDVVSWWKSWIPGINRKSGYVDEGE